MKRWFLVALFCLPLAAQTPTIVQWRGDPNNAGTLAPNGIVVNLPNATKSGNGLLVFTTTDDSPIGNITVTDNKGGGSSTYTVLKSQAGSSRIAAIFGTFNTAAGITQVKCNFSTGGAKDQCLVFEFDNLSTTGVTDGTCGINRTTGTSVTCSTGFTTTTNGDLICNYVVVNSFGTNPHGNTEFTASSPLALYQADGTSYDAVQCGVQGTAGAITPTLTTATAITSANTVAVAIKSASSGSVNTGTYVQGFDEINFSPSTANNGGQFTAAPNTTTLTMQFPCYGNTLAAAALQLISPDQHITGITDSNSNTWTARTASIRSGTGPSQMQWFTANNVTCNATEKLTLTFNASPVGDAGANNFPQIAVYDIANGGGYDTTAGTNNSHATSGSTGTTLTGSAITPSTANGVVLGAFQLDDNTTSNLTFSVGTGKFMTGCQFNTSGCDIHDINAYSQEAGFGHMYNSSTSATTASWVVTNTEGATTIGAWWDSVIAIKTQAAAGTTRRRAAVISR